MKGKTFHGFHVIINLFLYDGVVHVLTKQYVIKSYDVMYCHGYVTQLKKTQVIIQGCYKSKYIQNIKI